MQSRREWDVPKNLNELLANDDDGTWEDEQWTGTGFPEVFYLRYHYYATYFSLLSLSAYRRAMAGSVESEQVA